MVWFSQEARAYALATLLSAVTVLCLVGYAFGWSRWLAGWAASAALAWRRTTSSRSSCRRAPVAVAAGAARSPAAAAVGLVAVVGVALVPLAIGSSRPGTPTTSSTQPGHPLAQIPKQLLIGYASPGSTDTGLAALLVLVGAVTPLALSAPVRARAAWPLAVGVAALVVPILLALGGVDFLDTRNLLPGAAAARGRRWDRFRGLAGSREREPAARLVSGRHPARRSDWRRCRWSSWCWSTPTRATSATIGAASHTRSEPSPGARVLLVDPASGAIPLQVYLPGLRTLTAPVEVREIDVVVVPTNVRGGGIGRPPRVDRRGARHPPGSSLDGRRLRLDLHGAALHGAVARGDLAAALAAFDVAGREWLWRVVRGRGLDERAVHGRRRSQVMGYTISITSDARAFAAVAGTFLRPRSSSVSSWRGSSTACCRDATPSTSITSPAVRGGQGELVAVALRTPPHSLMCTQLPDPVASWRLS